MTVSASECGLPAKVSSSALNFAVSAACGGARACTLRAVKHETRTVRTGDGIDLFVETWHPSGDPKFVVVLSHGGAEHVGRYAHVAERLAASGGLVFGNDHRGQGKSGGPPGHIDNFAVDAADFLRVCDKTIDALPANQRPDQLPWFFYGHSMGGLVVLTYLCLYPDELPLRGAVVSSPLLGLAMRIPAIKRLGGEILFRVAPKLGVPSGMPSSAVSRDPEVVHAFETDPRRRPNYSPGWLKAMEAAVARVESVGPRIRTPMLVCAGTADRICDHHKTVAFFDRLREPDKNDQTLQLFEGCFHELHNEVAEDRERFLAVVEGWLLERLAQSSR